MSLSKQLYIIIAFIFFIIFTGNFIISIKNTKEYLEVESQTKAQDTATSLGMSLRPLIKDKKDPEIESIIKAISNSGFYKEIRLEDSDYIINDYELLDTIANYKNENWKIKKLFVDSKFGYVEKIQSDYELSEQLLQLEDDSITNDSFDDFNTETFERYRYIPTDAYKNGGKIPFTLIITNENETKDVIVKLDIKKILIEEKRDIKFDSVPAWFIELIPLELEEKFSEISDGWKKSAIIFVSPNPGVAYAKLFKQAKNSIIYAFIAFIISMIILFIFVQYLLRPLKRIESLAKSIALGKFETIDELPWTTEIKHVSIAMNDMSRKIEAIINKLNKNLQTLSEKLSQDELTKLPLKTTFETDMKQMFIQKGKGYILKIKINALSSFAKTHTNKEVNSFIIEFTDEIKNVLKEKEDSKEFKFYRFFGSEFMLIFENCDYSCTEKICKSLKNSFNLLADKHKVTEIAHIGATPFNNYSTTPEMLQATNEAYEKAKLIGPNDYFIRDNNDLIRDMEEWRDLIFTIIENNSFEIEYINDTYCSKDEEILLMQEAFTSAKDKNSKNIPIGTFVSIAEKYEKIVDFDMAVISKVIDYMVINDIKHDIMINLSLNSIEDEEFISWLENKIFTNKNIASQLLFSVTAYAVIKNIKGFKNFCDKVHNVGAKIIVKRFESKFIPLDNIKDFNLDFIRLARDYTTDIYLDTSKQSFVESIQELANLLNIKVYCENVNNNKDYEIVKKIKIDGISR